jgi:uncharacterized protein
VKVQVVEVDLARKRIALTMKLGGAPARHGGPADNRFQAAPGSARHRSSSAGAHSNASTSTAMSSAFAKLKGHGR